MREIKFRVFNKETKEMAEIQDFPSLLFEEKGRWFAMNGEKLFCNFMNGVLMQFTGLKDKNGNEIWEGDVLTDGVNKDVVKWIDCDAGFSTREYMPILVDACKWPNEAKIIGNIYENPELPTNQ